MAEMKAAGMEFAERIEELDKVTWPKPLGDFIYDTFNAFAAKHPWVAQENIRPKSVARDMLEKFCSFDDYVRDYGLQRSEGVVLRYLSQAYKALLQTVPEQLRTEEVDDVLEQLREMLRTVDSSLLDEWESLRGAGHAVVMSTSAAALGGHDDEPRPLAQNPRALGTRVRGELHRLLKALAQKRWDEAAAAVKAGTWTAETLAAELAPYFAEHASIDVTPAARRPNRTLIQPADEPGTFTARHTIVDPAGDEDWMIDAFVDARVVAGSEPIVELRGIRR
jgi:superfamily II RNA helicase